MISTTLLTGSALYVGYQAYTSPSWWRGVVGRLQRWRTQVLDQVQALKTQPACDSPQQPLAAAVTALGTATTALYLPPLRLVALPAFLYLGATVAHRGYRHRQNGERITPTVAEGVVVVICLAQGYYLVGALGFTCYYLGQVAAAARHRHQPLVVDWQPPTWAWRQSASDEVVTPVSQLQIGDQVVVHAGEMAPLSGVVAQGVAWVQRPNAIPAPAGEPAPMGIKVGAGQYVEAATIVLVGTICVTVTGVPAA